MKKIVALLSLLFAFTVTYGASIIRNAAPADTSQWICFRKVINVKGNPSKNKLRIAADSKYWLWVNGELEVYEGALKRGPNTKDTYIDNITLKNLKEGENTIAVLVWYFGKPGFSHRTSPCGGLYFDLRVGRERFGSDASWLTVMHPAYYLPAGEIPNFRLSESNIGFDARKDISNFFSTEFDDSSWQHAVEVDAQTADWNNFVDRSIPMWKNYGRRRYASERREGNKVICTLPYNAQVSPVLRVKAPAGKVIDIRTDCYRTGGGETNVRAEYITRDGEQEYENLGWMNGHEIIYTIPDGVEVLYLGYRETGYDCDFSGIFVCDNPDLNRLWRMSQRTLYITMRDNYMDCPDRERALWIGDVTNELVEAYYSLSPSANLLTRKSLIDFTGWQKPDSVLYAPVPQSNWDQELPMQSMAMIGMGAWNYYLGTGDVQTIRDIFPAAKRYVHMWKFQPDGLITYRRGGWDWGDWGTDADMQAMCQLWYSITLEYYARQAELIGEKEEAEWARTTNEAFKEAIHKACWTGEAYRHPTYEGKTDDRTQSLAILSGVAPESEYPQLMSIMDTTEFASPYMERYVLEAMCEIGNIEAAFKRMEKRYKPMVDSKHSTLWELFAYNGKDGSSYNHAWSGAPLIIMSKYVAGIHIVKPGFKEFKVCPELCSLNKVYAVVPTSYGDISLNVDKSSGYSLRLVVPEGTSAQVCLPAQYSGFLMNGKPAKLQKTDDGKYYTANVKAGAYSFVAR